MRCLGAWTAVVVSTVLLATCSGSGAPARDSGAAGAGEAGAPSAWSCQQIRMCVLGDGCTDAACVATCAAHGSAAAQATFETLRACTAKTCATDDVNCACGEQCMADGTCLHEADACVGATPVDDICDSLCA